MRAIILSIFTLLIISSCKNDGSIPDDGVLDIALKRDPVKIHPLVYNAQRARAVFDYIFLSGADYHPTTYELTPILLKTIPEAEVIESGPYQGKIKHEIELRDDITWDDGSPITGEDYLFTLKAILHPDADTRSYKSYFSDVIDAYIDPEDNLKVTVVFDDYYMLSKEIVSTIQIYPRYIYDAENVLGGVTIKELLSDDVYKELTVKDSSLVAWANTFGSIKFTREQVSGPGPYKLKEWISDQLIVLERKENYWGAGSDEPVLQANPKEIVFHIIPDEVTIMSQLKSGTIDLYPGASVNAVNELKTNTTLADNYQLLTAEILRSYFISINNIKPELSSKVTRRALAHLVDVDEIISLMEGGMAKKSNSIINIKKDIHHDDLAYVPKDITKAKNLLTQEGWSDTNNNGTIDKTIDGELVEFDVDLHVTASPLSNNIALIFSEAAKSVGIKINIIQKKYSDFRKDELANQTYDLVTSSLTQDFPPDDPYNKWHSDNATKGGGNTSVYKSPLADSLIEEIRDTEDEGKRKELYFKLQEVMYDDQPVIHLYHPMEKLILSKKWNGYATPKRPGYLANTFTLRK